MQINYSVVLPYLRDPKRPYLDAIIEARDGDTRIGYLSFEWISSQILDQCLPTVWHWVNEFTGWCLGTGPAMDMSDPDVIHRLWRDVQSYNSYSWQPPANTPSISQMLDDLDEIAQRHRFYRRYEEYKTSADYVYVGYSKVDDGWSKSTRNYQGMGIGSTMYQLAAMWLAVNYDTALHSSTLRSDSAVGVWEKMMALGYPIYRIRRPETNKYVLALDYTQTAYLLERSRRRVNLLPETKHHEHPTIYP